MARWKARTLLFCVGYVGTRVRVCVSMRNTPYVRALFNLKGVLKKARGYKLAGHFQQTQSQKHKHKQRRICQRRICRKRTGMLHVCVCSNIFVSLCVCACVYVCACDCVCMYVCKSMNVWLYICVYMCDGFSGLWLRLDSGFAGFWLCVCMCGCCLLFSSMMSSQFSGCGSTCRVLSKAELRTGWSS